MGEWLDSWQRLAGAQVTVVLAAVGTGLLGFVSGAVGSFAVLRKQSLLGDAISHAALPGIALAYLFTGSKSSLVLVLGAAAAAWTATLLILAILRGSRVKEDGALGLVLASFFGLGLMLLTFLQSYPRSAGWAARLLFGTQPVDSPAGLTGYLFGQAATLSPGDVAVIAVLGGLALAVLVLCWKQFKLVTFDPEYAAVIGMPARGLDVLLTLLLVIAIVIGLQTVGVVLMSSLVVAPATAARQWTNRLGVMVLLAALFGLGGGVAGSVLSSTTDRLPPGPTIVLVLSGLVVVSLAVAPRRGLLWESVRHWQNRRQLRVEGVLDDLFTLAQQHREEHAHPLSVLQAMAPGRDVARSLRELERRGWARQTEGGWLLTPAGRATVQGRPQGAES